MKKCMKENRQNTARDLNIKIKYEASGAGEILETIWKFPDWASTSSSDHLLPFQKDDVHLIKVSFQKEQQIGDQAITSQ